MEKKEKEKIATKEKNEATIIMTMTIKLLLVGWLPNVPAIC